MIFIKNDEKTYLTFSSVHQIIRVKPGCKLSVTTASQLDKICPPALIKVIAVTFRCIRK